MPTAFFFFAYTDLKKKVFKNASRWADYISFLITRGFISLRALARACRKNAERVFFFAYTDLKKKVFKFAITRR